MHKLNELREMLMEELNKCASKGELSAGSLDVVDKLTHAIKSIDTILAMEEAGYSNEGGYSGARGRGRYAKRDSMGRYSSRGGSYNAYDDGSYDDMSYEGGSYRGGRGGNRGGYSRNYRDGAKDELKMELKDIAMDTNDPEAKQMIHRWIKELEQD